MSNYPHLATRDDDDLVVCRTAFIGAFIEYDSTDILLWIADHEMGIEAPLYQVYMRTSDPAKFRAAQERLDEWYASGEVLVFCRARDDVRPPTLSPARGKENCYIILPRPAR